MSALYGRLQGNRGEVTRTASTQITATLETWESAVTLTLYKDGSYVVQVGPKHGFAEFVYKGNADEEVRA